MPNDDHVRLATSLVGATTKHVRSATSLVGEETNLVEDMVDLARRRSRFAAFVTLKSVSLRSAVQLAT